MKKAPVSLSNTPRPSNDWGAAERRERHLRHLDEVARIGMQQAAALVNSVRGEAGAASGTKPAPVDFEKIAAEYVRIAKVVQDAIAASVRIAKGARTPKVSEAVLAERRRRMH